jgi:lipooligosaccharide transport system permease protein
MVSTALPHLVAMRSSGRRAGSVVGRNVATLSWAYWVVLVGGFVEPVLYLFSIGIGVGRLIGDLPLPDGRSVPYAQFVAPAMLAASAMTGALSETTFNFYGKMKYMRLYDGMLATPIRPMEVALGELAWAMLRGTVYSAAFLVLMAVLDLTSWPRAAAAFPATVLVGFAFGGAGMAMSTFLRSWQEFDLIGSVEFALFLFSGTFVPAQAYPAVVRWVIEATPLYRSVDLIRGISTGGAGWTQAVDVAYLLAVLVVGLWVAGRRMERLLCK